MPKKAGDKNNSIKEKLEYIGLDLENIPEELKEYKPLEFRIPKFYEEKQYKQYRYIPVKDIQILLSPTNRLDEISEKYKQAKPLAQYLDGENEENILKYTTFLSMLKQFKIDEVEEIEKEQTSLSKKIPFKVKYENNYLWQIYYSENTNQYFMLVPTEDSDYSTFFFLIKKKLEKKKNIKIGETRGKLENLFLTIKNMLNFNLTDEEIIKYTNATQEQIDQVRKKLK